MNLLTDTITKVVLVTTIIGFAFALWRSTAWMRPNKCVSVSDPKSGPYRSLGEMPEEIKQETIAKKREFKMPLFKTTKHVKTFLLMTLTASCAPIMGAIHDLHDVHPKLFGDGIVNGGMVFFGIMGAFLFIMTMHNASDGFKGWV